VLRTLHDCQHNVIVVGMAHMHTVTNQVLPLENRNRALATGMGGERGGAFGSPPGGLNVAPILARALVTG
jgi:hypothetical protein